MNKHNVDKLLNNKNWSGEDIGRASLIDWIKTTCNKQDTVSISSEDLNKLLNQLKDNYEIKKYNGYVRLIRTLYDDRIRYYTYYEVFKSNKYTLLSYITNTFSLVHTQYDYIHDKKPYVTTEKEYKKRYKEWEDIYNGTDYSALCLIDQALQYLINEEEAPKEIKEEINKLYEVDIDTIKDKELLDQVKPIYSKLYTVRGITNGEEREEHWTDEDIEDIISTSMKTSGDAEVINKLEDTYIHKLSREEQLRELKRILNKKALDNEDTPLNITEIEVGEQELKLIDVLNVLDELYPVYLEKNEEVTDNLIKRFTIYQKYYNPLLKLVLKYIEAKGIAHAKSWITAKPKDLLNITYTYKQLKGNYELFNIDISDSLLYADAPIESGLALLKEDSDINTETIKRFLELHKTNDISTSMLYSLPNNFIQVSKRKDSLELLLECINELRASYNYLKGYNQLLDLIAKIHDIEEVNILKENYLEEAKDGLQAISNSAYYLHYKVRTTYSGEDKEDVLNAIEEYLLFDFDKEKPIASEEDLEEAKEIIKDLYNIENKDKRLLTLLCWKHI